MESSASATSVKLNLIANFLATAWGALIGLLFVPLYIHFMGIEAYGLVGIFVTLQAMASLFDLGFTTTMNREMARFSTQPEALDEARNLVRTLEVIYWGIAVLIGAIVVSFSPVLTDRWITRVHLSRDTVLTALMLIGFIIMLHWPLSFYAAGLMGLQKQVLLSTINAGLATIRGFGAILILWLISPTVQAFFGWQLFISAVSTLMVAVFLWRHLTSSSTRPRFRKAHLRRVWRFSAGVAFVSVIGLVLVQMDKIILSKLLTLENFGYYALAGTVSTSLYMVISPVYNAVFPRMVQLAVAEDQAALIDFYHKSAQVMAALVISATIVLAIFSYQIVYVWTGNLLTAANTFSIVTLLAIGTGIYGLMHVLWAAQLAYAWTRLALVLNLIAIVLFMPLIVLLSSRYGATGGAAAWLLLNLAYLVVDPVLMHRRILKGELLHWILIDTARPTLAALVVAALGRFLIHTDVPRPLLCFELFAVALCTLLAALSVVSSIRISFLRHLTTRYHALLAKRNPPTSGTTSGSADVIL
jgi:O-antigen/teichoic acid export membrane protein